MNRVLITNTTPGNDSSATAVPELSFEPAVTFAGTATDGFFIATRHVLLTGTPATGAQSVWLDRKHVVQHFHVDTLHCREFRQSPLGAERVLAHEASRVVERMVAAPDTPALILEWHANQEVEFDVAWTTSDDAAAVFVFSSTVDVTSVQSGSSTTISAHVKLAPHAPLQLLLAGNAALVKDAHAARWARAHATAAQRRRSELMRIEVDDAELVRGWEWAKHQVAMQLLRAKPDAELLIAHIVLGDFAAVRKQLTPAVEPYFHAAAGDDASVLPPDPPEPADADWQPAREPATLITSFVRAVLGYTPDAARGRLTLRPRVPAAWSRLLVHNIPIGDARIRLSYEQTARECRFRIAQTDGAYPVRLIAEPLLLRQPRQTLVDGVSAQLSFRSSGDRVIAPVQIMLDNERTVDFRFF